VLDKLLNRPWNEVVCAYHCVHGLPLSAPFLVSQIKCSTGTSPCHHILSLHSHKTVTRSAALQLHSLERDAASALAQAHIKLLPAHEAAPASLSDVLQQLAQLHTHVATLQQHLAGLALDLLQERTEHYEQRLHTLEALASQPLESFQGPQQADVVDPLAPSPSPERRLLPVEVRARSRVTALIEYGAQGQYVAVCPRQGVLSLVPDAPEWFDWLATLSSFRFMGPAGRFSACRASKKGQHTRRWAARRSFHGHDCWHYLGVTDRLTLASLEQAAAALQARVDAL